MARDGQNLEWLSPDDENDIAPLPAPSAGSALTSRLSTWGPLRNRTARRVIGGLILFAAVLLFARVGAQDQLPGAPVKPPQWLQNRPITAPLSPFMAPECTNAHCRVLTASETDVRHMHAGYDSRFTVTAIRVRDANGNLRGTQVLVMDAQGDSLSMEAVRVSEAPTHWDGESANLDPDSPMSRWAVRTRNGVWLIEVHAQPGRPCDGDQQEYAVLYAMALVRVRANQLSL